MDWAEAGCGRVRTPKETVLNGFSERFKWHQEGETVENGFMCAGPLDHPLKRGVNESRPRR